MAKQAKPRTTRQKLLRAFAVLAVLGVLAAAIPFGINLYMIAYAKPYILTPAEVAAQEGLDCALVLGAKVHANGNPSHMLEDRLIFGIDLYQNGAVPKLLLSGDHGTKGYNEVGGMKAYAEKKDIPEDDLFMDHAGFSTYDSLYRARDVFAVKRLVVVTQEYHLYRAVYIARKLGLDAYGVASDPREYANEWFYNMTRESLARCKAFAMCLYKPEPTYLGEAIPIQGSGKATNDGFSA